MPWQLPFSGSGFGAGTPRVRIDNNFSTSDCEFEVDILFSSFGQDRGIFQARRSENADIIAWYDEPNGVSLFIRNLSQGNNSFQVFQNNSLLALDTWYNLKFRLSSINNLVEILVDDVVVNSATWNFGLNDWDYLYLSDDAQESTRPLHGIIRRFKYTSFAVQGDNIDLYNNVSATQTSWPDQEGNATTAFGHFETPPEWAFFSFGQVVDTVTVTTESKISTQLHAANSVINLGNQGSFNGGFFNSAPYSYVNSEQVTGVLPANIDVALPIISAIVEGKQEVVVNSITYVVSAVPTSVEVISEATSLNISQFISALAVTSQQTTEFSSLSLDSELSLTSLISETRVENTILSANITTFINAQTSEQKTGVVLYELAGDVDVQTALTESKTEIEALTSDIVTQLSSEQIEILTALQTIRADVVVSADVVETEQLTRAVTTVLTELNDLQALVVQQLTQVTPLQSTTLANVSAVQSEAVTEFLSAQTSTSKTLNAQTLEQIVSATTLELASGTTFISVLTEGHVSAQTLSSGSVVIVNATSTEQDNKTSLVDTTKVLNVDVIETEVVFEVGQIALLAEDDLISVATESGTYTVPSSSVSEVVVISISSEGIVSYQPVSILVGDVTPGTEIDRFLIYKLQDISEKFVLALRQ